MIGPVPQGVPHQIPDRHVAGRPDRTPRTGGSWTGGAATPACPSMVSSIEMTRPSAGRSETRAFSSVVLPEPVPPENQDIAPAPEHGRRMFDHQIRQGTGRGPLVDAESPGRRSGEW